MVFDLLFTLGLFASLVYFIVYVLNEPKVVKVKRKEDRCSEDWKDPKNTHIVYLYVHNETGELKTMSYPRKTRVEPHNDINWSVIDIWWEPSDV